MAAKAPDAYLHGDDGPIVIVPARVAAFLKRYTALDEARLRVRTADSEIYDVLSSLHRAALAYMPPDPARESEPVKDGVAATVTTRQAAGILNLSTRGVRDACEKGRLEGRIVENRWIISLASVRRYARID